MNTVYCKTVTRSRPGIDEAESVDSLKSLIAITEEHLPIAIDWITVAVDVLERLPLPWSADTRQHGFATFAQPCIQTGVLWPAGNENKRAPNPDLHWHQVVVRSFEAFDAPEPFFHLKSTVQAVLQAVVRAREA